MRLLCFLLLLGAACAQIDPPPGGPEDRMPPRLVAQQPDTLAVVPGWNRPVVFRFSERISEQQVEQSVMVSPRTSPVVVDRGSREVRVSLRRGWEPGTIYHVTVLPQIQDLFNNRLAQPLRIVFSTGPAIPETRLTGLVRDRITGEPQVETRVEAIRRPDSLVYAVLSDSLGRFDLTYLPEGEYLVRAFPDQNLNRNLDVTEARDSLLATVTTADTADVEFSIVLPDSTAPVIASARATPEGRVEVRFDDYLDPAQGLTTAAVTLLDPQGTPVPLLAVSIGEPAARQGSVGVDTTAAPAAAAPDPVGAPPDTAAAGQADTAVVAIDTAAVAGDTTAVAADNTGAAAEPALPSQLLVIQLAEGAQLTPEAEYTVSVTGIRNVVGLTGDAEGRFTAPAPQPAPEQPADAAPPAEADGDAEPDPEPEPLIP